MTADLFDKVRLAREGAAVERCHTAPHLQRYSVGHHSLDLVTLITLAWMEDHERAYPSSMLLVAAAFHDIPERITGDLPQPVKEHIGGIEGAERATLGWLNVNSVLLPEEQDYLHHGDKLELYLWCWEEAQRGNDGFRGWVSGYQAYWHDNPPPPAYRNILAAVHEKDGLPILQWDQLKEIAGL